MAYWLEAAKEMCFLRHFLHLMLHAFHHVFVGCSSIYWSKWLLERICFSNFCAIWLLVIVILIGHLIVFAQKRFLKVWIVTLFVSSLLGSKTVSDAVED